MLVLEHSLAEDPRGPEREDQGCDGLWPLSPAWLVLLFVSIHNKVKVITYDEASGERDSATRRAVMCAQQCSRAFSAPRALF